MVISPSKQTAGEMLPLGFFMFHSCVRIEITFFFAVVTETID